VPVTCFGISNKISTTSPTHMARRVAKQTPVVEMFNALVYSLSDSGILRLKDNEVCSLKRGVLRRSGVGTDYCRTAPRQELSRRIQWRSCNGLNFVLRDISKRGVQVGSKNICHNFWVTLRTFGLSGK
jgi:hypothetical protein